MNILASEHIKLDAIYNSPRKENAENAKMANNWVSEIKSSNKFFYVITVLEIDLEYFASIWN